MEIVQNKRNERLFNEKIKKDFIDNTEIWLNTKSEINSDDLIKIEKELNWETTSKFTRYTTEVK